MAIGYSYCFCYNGIIFTYNNHFNTMRRRREDIIKDTLKDVLKSEAKGLLGTIVKLFLAKLVDIIMRALTKPVDELDGSAIVDMNGENEFV